MDTIDIVNKIHDITTFILYLILMILTILYVICFKRKNENLSIKEKINCNLIVSYIIFSLSKIILSSFQLFAQNVLSIDLIKVITHIFSSLLIVCYCFYIYMFSISLKNHKETNFVFYSIMFWIIGTIVFFVYCIFTKMEIKKLTALPIIMIILVISLQLLLSSFLTIKIIFLIINYNKLWKEYEEGSGELENKYNNKKTVIFICVMMILNILLNLGSFSNKLYEMIGKIYDISINNNIDLIGKMVLLFTNSINHILVLLIFIYDEDIYDKILCRKVFSNKRINSVQINFTEYFISK